MTSARHHRCEKTPLILIADAGRTPHARLFSAIASRKREKLSAFARIIRTKFVCVRFNIQQGVTL